MPKKAEHTQQLLFSDRVLTVPNALTFFRLLAVPVVVWLLLIERDAMAVALFALAAVTDFLDGLIARATRPSYLGRILDPVADRLMLSSVAVVLAVRGLLPAWAVAILVGRDVITLAGTLLLRHRIEVNLIGKAATAALMVSVALVVYGEEIMGKITFYSGFALSLVAVAFYAARVFRVYAGRRVAR